ncbi:MAG: hypothetical protein PHX13_04415 [Thiovulaceae bacterium]|nr:hypothetical protein [Sulfurimonadaceae bacterium]
MKFFILFLFFIALSFLIWIGLILGEVGNPTKTSQWVYDAYEKKYQIAQNISKKKIVIVAGSNALFGVNSKMIEDAFGMPVVNYGVNAGIELPLTLELAKRVINPGDIVISPLEYPMYSSTGSPGVQMIDYVLAREPQLFWKLTFYEELYIVWHVDLKRIWDGYFNKSNSRVTNGLYGAHHIDNHGDQIQSSEKYRTEWMLNELKNNYGLHPEKYGAEFSEKGRGWKYLETFVVWCEERDVEVIFMPSTLLRQESYFKNTKERWFYENIAAEVRKRGWTYIGNPYDYMYDTKYYFDTNFHLVEKARKFRTQKMIEDLNKSAMFNISFSI